MGLKRKKLLSFTRLSYGFNDLTITIFELVKFVHDNINKSLYIHTISNVKQFQMYV